jgi:3-keto-disaccharide hydrolase
MKHCCLAGVLVVSLLAGNVQAQKKKPGDVYTDPAQAGPDFKVQGEYVGDVSGKGKLGAQVVALGAGKFDVYLLAGGLPGAGWDTKTRTRVPAKTEGEKTTFSGSGWSGTITAGKVTGKGADAGAFTLNRVERQSPTLGSKPPRGAVVLFDGSSAEHWNKGEIVEGNLLRMGTQSKKPLGIGKLHIEFRPPFQPRARGQGRGNSGVYVMGTEVQVLDSFGLNGEKNECGALYGREKPAVNMCFPPLSWQTYEIEVKPGTKKDELLMTVWHNGVKVHDNFPLRGAATRTASVNLQNHGNPVAYRNIWFVPERSASSSKVKGPR